MPDFNLPGISNKIDIKEIIDSLVKVESKKLDRFEKARGQLNKEKSAWINLGNKINDLQNTCKELYGFRSPFEDKIAISSEEAIVSAKASRIAYPSRNIIKVEQVAQSERIISDPVENKRIFKKVPHLRLNIGGEEFEVHFEGGRIDNLVEALNKQAGDHITAKITKDTQDTSVLILESKRTGSKNRITVDDRDTFDLFKDIGLFEEKEALRVDTRFQKEKIVPLEKSFEYHLEDDILSLDPKNSVQFVIDKEVKASPDIYLKIKVRAIDIEKEKVEEVPVTWPEIKNIGKVTVRDIEIEGGKSVSNIAEKIEIKEEPIVIDNTVIGVIDSRGLKSTVEIDELSDEFREYIYKLTDIVNEGDRVQKITFINNNTMRRIEYKDLVIEDISEIEGIVPKHIVQQARDSIINIDGVKIQRETNEIDDALKGVNLKLMKASDDEVVLTIDRDFEKITQKTIAMIEHYNTLLKFINDHTKVVASGNLTEENEAGILSGNITVFGLKNKLQNIMMNPYPTDMGRGLSLLAQIGISMGAHGTSWNDIKGGYLQVDEDKYIEAFKNYPEIVKQLFGSDTNNDMVIDNGVAYVMEKMLKGYSDPKTGIVTYNIKDTDTGIRDQEKRIDEWSEHLEEYRKKLESDFTIMQQALHELEQNQKSLENFSNQLRNK